jgi:hypothetical protein
MVLLTGSLGRLTKCRNHIKSILMINPLCILRACLRSYSTKVEVDDRKEDAKFLIMSFPPLSGCSWDCNTDDNGLLSVIGVRSFVDLARMRTYSRKACSKIRYEINAALQ